MKQEIESRLIEMIERQTLALEMIATTLNKLRWG